MARACEMGPRASQMTRTPIPVRHRRTYATTHCRPAPRHSTNRSTPSRHGSCASNAIAAARCRWSAKFVTVRQADPRHPRPGAPRRLRRQGRARGTALRHRGRQQPSGAPDRAARGLRGVRPDVMIPGKTCLTRPGRPSSGRRCRADTVTRGRHRSRWRVTLLCHATDRRTPQSSATPHGQPKWGRRRKNPARRPKFGSG